MAHTSKMKSYKKPMKSKSMKYKSKASPTSKGKKKMSKAGGVKRMKGY